VYRVSIVSLLCLWSRFYVYCLYLVLSVCVFVCVCRLSSVVCILCGVCVCVCRLSSVGLLSFVSSLSLSCLSILCLFSVSLVWGGGLLRAHGLVRLMHVNGITDSCMWMGLGCRAY